LQKRCGVVWVAAPPQDPVMPDLAFSLPSALLPERAPLAGQVPAVAVGLYTVDGGAEGLERYAALIGSFVAWLLARGHRVRLVIGDAEYDPAAMSAVKRWLADKGQLDQVQTQEAESFQVLLQQLSEVDLVVATRFHNVLLSLLLVKPVLSISHMDKNDQLMDSMGLSRFCTPLEGARLEQITAGFERLQEEAPALRDSIRAHAAANRARLEQQYARLFDLSSRGAAGR
jgi:polysaccharide pyruvyl transferase WcaK-like protein